MKYLCFLLSWAYESPKGLAKTLAEREVLRLLCCHSVRSIFRSCFIIQCLTYIIIIEDPVLKSCVSIDLHYICLFTLEGRMAVDTGSNNACPQVFKTLFRLDCSLWQRLYTISQSLLFLPSIIEEFKLDTLYN